jgi:DNA polymerase-3 subunit gamma/tau
MVDTADLNVGVTSLYRRFRPGRFAEMRGQEHVVRALRGAVAHNRVVHAYLFSGPRGTGKTTTARILAKALNCEAPDEGDACNACASCVAITRGSSLDVVELDAASNNGVDDVREIIAGAWYGTPGRWKVYILDEVHMLSPQAEAAFLKTLEEPPAHVVFVLATTDPHKVVPTIRSRTQHLEFRLFAAETLSSLLHDVNDQAHLGLDEATMAAAVRMGHGSARDALSALDQVLATGSLGELAPAFDDLLGALASTDAVETLAALSELSRSGWEPEQLAEAFAGELRQIFLLQVAPEVADALDVERERLDQWGRQLGLARTVRVLETVGRTLREMKSSPVPSILLEVALVRLARPELDDAVSALEDRLSRVERQLAERPAAPATRPSAPRPIAQPTTPGPPPTTATDEVEPEVVAASPRDVAAPGSDGTLPDFDQFVARFDAKVLSRLSKSAQSLLTHARAQSLTGTVLTIAVSSESYKASADKIQSGLRSALEHEFSTPIQVRWVVDTSIADAAPEPSAPPEGASDVGVDELDDLDIATSEEIPVDSAAVLLITEAFPGAEEIG